MGWGDFSPISTFYTFSQPGSPTSISTTVNNMNVKISWMAPNSNFKPVDAYKIKIKNKATGLYYEDLSYCDGSLSTIISQLYCEIPMNRLRSSPYNLKYGYDVIATV